MRPSSREMEEMDAIAAAGCLNASSRQISSSFHEQQENSEIPPFETPSHDDFLEQMLSVIPNCSHWPDLTSNPEIPVDAVHYPFDDSPLLSASKLRQHQINGADDSSVASKSFLLQQQLLLSGGVAGGGDSGLLPFPSSLASGDSVDTRLPVDRSQLDGGDGSVQALYNGFAGSVNENGQTANHQHFQAGTMPAQNYGAPATAALMNHTQGSASTGGSGPAPQRQRVRARRGQATDPHSIAERLRRERIAERMKALQELVPNANKTDKSSMLDEIIDYVKFLQLQVKVLSMSRLGGAAAVAPLVADISSEGGGVGRSSDGGQPTAAAASNENLIVTEHHVAKLMEEDMGSAMQYLQGKGLCLMPICRSTAANHHRHSPTSNGGISSNPRMASEGEGHASPNLSHLAVPSACVTDGAGGPDAAAMDAASASKP
ncbi:hypothetical protein Nepgr_020836 [Nepenthes gracilis]|uniref:BHLH domain-containing protein n=1 Tax=Nepenthes gracilis TaxID=150966 RepID=A0AAD3SVZ7_NEPGR|nr:hypothetical protein Nepgr_020836 [Nepenthes gracilis]